MSLERFPFCGLWNDCAPNGGNYRQKSVNFFVRPIMPSLRDGGRFGPGFHGLRFAPPVAIFIRSLRDGHLRCGNRSREARRGYCFPPIPHKTRNGWGTHLLV